MKVHFFDVKPRRHEAIEELSRAFGSNIPHYLPLEGGDSQVVFCLNLDLDTIISICQAHDCDICGLWEDTPMFRRHAFTEIDVDPALYNVQHMVGIKYFSNAHYVLEPIPKHKLIKYVKENAVNSNSGCKQS